MFDRPHRPLLGSGPRDASGLDRTDAWVGAVAAALAEVERSRAEGESPDLWGTEGAWGAESQEGRAERRRRAAGRSALRLDLAFFGRQILVAVMELPEDDRTLILGRYREGCSIDQLARREGLRRRFVSQRLRMVLLGVGARTRDACGGSASVYGAALAAIAERRVARRPARGGLVAAAAVLLVLAGLGLSGGSDSTTDGAPRAVAAGARERVPALRANDRPDTTAVDDVTVAEAEPAAAGAGPSAAEVDELAVLQGRVRLLGGPETGGPRDGDYLGQARATSGGLEHVALVDRDGRFSFAGLEAGSWRITLRLSGYETVGVEVEIDPLDPPAPIELEALPVRRVEVGLFDPDGQPLFEVPGLASDWAVTNGLTAWLTSEPPGARIERVDLAGGDNWDRLGTFERLDPVDMARPSVLGLLVVERPSAARWISLVYGDHVLSTQPFVAGKSPVIFDVDPSRLAAMRSSVKLLLRSLLGLDPAGAVVRLIGPNGEILERRVGEDGILRLDGLPPGRWMIEVVLRGHGVLRRAYDVDGGGEFSEELDLSASLRVFGQVKNLAGVPIGAGIRAIDLSLLESDPASLQFQPNTSSSQYAAGSYSFRDLASDSDWVLVIEHEDFALTAYGVDGGQTSKSLDLTATPGHDVTLTWGANAVDPGRMMLLRDANSLPLALISPTADLAHQFKLKPGNYSLTLWEDGDWGKHFTFDVPHSSVQVGVNW